MIGDYNARIIESLPSEATHIGQHILQEEGASIENTLSLGQKQNRELFMDFIFEKDYFPMNTWFEKPMEKLVTFAEMHNQDKILPAEPEHDAQLDYMITTRKWRHIIKDVEHTKET